MKVIFTLQSPEIKNIIEFFEEEGITLDSKTLISVIDEIEQQVSWDVIDSDTLSDIYNEVNAQIIMGCKARLTNSSLPQK